MFRQHVAIQLKLSRVIVILTYVDRFFFSQRIIDSYRHQQQFDQLVQDGLNSKS